MMHKTKKNIEDDEESTFSFEDEGPSRYVEEIVEEPVKTSNTLASFFGFGSSQQPDSKKTLL